jgi:hypothetical protein
MHEANRPPYRNVLPALLLVLTGTACSAGTATSTTPAAQKSPQESSVMEPAPASGTTPVDCGQAFSLPAGGALALTGRFPAEVPAGEQILSGTVEAVSSQQLRGVAPPGADVFLVRDGHVVSIPLPQDAMGILWAVAAGEPKSLPAEASLVSCDTGEPLASGSYELYVRMTVIPDDGGSVESFGGPWPLEVR